MRSGLTLKTALQADGFALVDLMSPIETDGALAAARAFFESDTRHRYEAANGALTGYFPCARERAVGSNSPDQKEFYQARSVEDLALELRPAFGAILDAAYQIAQIVADELMLGAHNVAVDYAADHSGMLRLVRYARNGGAATHTDITLFTLMLCETEPGVSVITRDGGVRRVYIPPGKIAVLAGDMLELVTQGDIRACRHFADSEAKRCSVLFFANPPDSTMLEPGITARQALDRRLAEMR
jgi:isopenicillin N synthase-like dioxygenase